MDLDHWKQLDSLLQSVLERPPEERDAFLRHACEGDETLERRVRGLLTAEVSQMTASMFRDIKVGAPVEADHVIGDLVARGNAAKVPVPKLRAAYTHLKAYEKQRG